MFKRFFVWLSGPREPPAPAAKPTSCPVCDSTNITAHMGRAECLNPGCEYEWSYDE